MNLATEKPRFELDSLTMMSHRIPQHRGNTSAVALEISAGSSTVLPLGILAPLSTVPIFPQSEKARLIDAVTVLVGVGKVDQALDRIFETFNQLFTLGRFSTADTVLNAFSVTSSATDVLVGLLSATFAARESLLHRQGFYQRVRKELRVRHGWVTSRRLVDGLE